MQYKKCSDNLKKVQNKNYTPDFVQARKEALNEASDEYYSALNDYVTIYQTYLNGDTSQHTQDKIQKANQKLIDINNNIQSNNQKTASDIGNLYDSYKDTIENTLLTKSKNVAILSEAVDDHKVSHESLQQQLIQLKRNYRRQNIITFAYIIFILILLYSMYFMYGILSKVLENSN